MNNHIIDIVTSNFETLYFVRMGKMKSAQGTSTLASWWVCNSQILNQILFRIMMEHMSFTLSLVSLFQGT